MISRNPISRRAMLRTGAGIAAAATVGAPAILHAQTATLKITTWGGKWGDIMKASVLPAFEKEFKCTVSADSAFPYVPKLAASSRTKCASPLDSLMPMMLGCELSSATASTGRSYAVNGGTLYSMTGSGERSATKR